ncbi:MAG: endonuclease Q family protein [candidate division Zixibacteria bacterium]|nr:endonuclease Q family protein [candidate division Zixibacteria bacterium]
MRFIADFHIHSKYSRATSKEMEVESLSRWAEIKGISLLGTGDFTHPLYLSELKEKLEPLGNGLFQLKNKKSSTKFILTAEVNNIFHQFGRLRKIHTVIFAPSFEVVEKINQKLKSLGKLESDGRPIFTFPVKDLVKIILGVSEYCLIVPGHAWTPWFSIFGANSGFDSIEECFGEYSRDIYSIETGLSSDPEMNWRLSRLDNITLMSNSDAHSPSKLGREANVFDCELDYNEILQVIKTKDKSRFLFTIEFFPEEGKYHFDGHRNCGVLSSPSETKKNKNLCPVCHKKLTVGVMHRVEDLADRSQGFVPPNSIPSKHIIPLPEIIADVLGQAPDTKGVEAEYKKMIQNFGNEFKILLDLSIEDISSKTSPKIAEGIKRVREGKLNIIPGHDGVYGKIKIFEEGREEEVKKETEQLGLF